MLNLNEKLKIAGVFGVFVFAKLSGPGFHRTFIAWNYAIWLTKYVWAHVQKRKKDHLKRDEKESQKTEMVVVANELAMSKIAIKMKVEHWWPY